MALCFSHQGVLYLVLDEENVARDLQVGAVRLQMDVKSAQKVGLDILAATEAAISDASVVKLLVEKLGLDERRAAMVLLDLREIRQGSRDVVFLQ